MTKNMPYISLNCLILTLKELLFNTYKVIRWLTKQIPSSNQTQSKNNSDNISEKISPPFEQLYKIKAIIENTVRRIHSQIVFIWNIMNNKN